MEKIKKYTYKDLGVVLTPTLTAEYIVSKLGPFEEDSKILEPCVGPGIFIQALLKKGVKREQIYTYDINSIFRENIEELGVRFEKLDTLLSFNSTDFNRFDYIIGNPPYLNKASEYIRRNKKELKKIYGKINAHETYSMFIVNGLWRLREGGKLVFITSDSFLSLNTHTKLRKFLIENCLIEEILLAPKNLFSKQNVSTSPVIITLIKCYNDKKRIQNIMRIIPRISSEKEYLNPKKVLKVEQKKYQSLPFNIFFIDVEKEVIGIFEEADKLENFLKGYIGMHTHNNKKYIAAIEGTKLAESYKLRNRKQNDETNKFKIITNEEFRTKNWKPYLKRGGSEQYYRPISEALDWNEESRKIYDIPKYVPFEKEGVVISGVSSLLAARYMPKGCFWDSNKAIGFIPKDDSISINFFLGLLNSSLYNFFAKGIINNTNSIQLTGIHALPFINPDDDFQSNVELKVEEILVKKRKNPNYSYVDEQKKIDNLVFDFFAKNFDLPIGLKKKIDGNYSIY